MQSTRSNNAKQKTFHSVLSFSPLSIKNSICHRNIYEVNITQELPVLFNLATIFHMYYLGWHLIFTLEHILTDEYIHILVDYLQKISGMQHGETNMINKHRNDLKPFFSCLAYITFERPQYKFLFNSQFVQVGNLRILFIILF